MDEQYWNLPKLIEIAEINQKFRNGFLQPRKKDTGRR